MGTEIEIMRINPRQGQERHGGNGEAKYAWCIKKGFVYMYFFRVLGLYNQSS